MMNIAAAFEFVDRARQTLPWKIGVSILEYGAESAKFSNFGMTVMVSFLVWFTGWLRSWGWKTDTILAGYLTMIGIEMVHHVATDEDVRSHVRRWAP